MLVSDLVLNLLERVPVLLDGRTLHRAGLRALAAGDPARARRMFACAALRYRRELRVEALARVRVHQLIAAARAGGDPEDALEVEWRLRRLDTIEALDAPHARIDARRLMAAWDEAAPRRAA
jgi:hypothetical protein